MAFGRAGTACHLTAGVDAIPDCCSSTQRSQVASPLTRSASSVSQKACGGDSGRVETPVT